ncbi:hypothetical protein COO60DRAFT_1699015 [Scenedesmus sp. NREL 46B-D3]|nr:hypothetical protein COO60DRAFT_1699015 [Scenedesmus sp. NREL 46B-D3]
MICSRCGTSTSATNLEWLQAWLVLVMLQHGLMMHNPSCTLLAQQNLTAIHSRSNTADEDTDDDNFSDDDDEDDEVEAAGALTSMRAAGQAAAAGGRGPMKRQQQKKKQKATAKRARVVAPPTLPEQPGAPRVSSRETRPNPKYTDYNV